VNIICSTRVYERVLKSVVATTQVRPKFVFFFFPMGTFTAFEGPTRRRVYRLQQVLIGTYLRHYNITVFTIHLPGGRVGGGIFIVLLWRRTFLSFPIPILHTRYNRCTTCCSSGIICIRILLLNVSQSSRTGIRCLIQLHCIIITKNV